MASVLRTVALLVLLTLLGVAQDANAYSAVTLPCWTPSSVAAPPGGWQCFDSAANAASAGAIKQTGKDVFPERVIIGPQSDGSINSSTQNGFWSWCAYTPPGQTTCTPSGFYLMANNPALQCPSGGTLSGNECVCGQNETDTGSSCTQPESCPAGQYDPVGGPTECVPICGANEAVYDPAGQGFSYPSGAKTFCSETTVAGEGGDVTAHCLAEPTGSVIVCGDYGDSVACFSEHARYTGGQCAAAVETTLEDDVTVCAEGEVWCKSNGACGAGFVGGSFAGADICVKKGESVNVVPQPKSSAAPPLSSSLTDPPTQSNPGTKDGETNDPNLRTVVGVGSGTMGGGGGGGGGGGDDIITCGLPNTPACKIDEEGTPDGADADTAAKAGIETEAGKLTTKLDEIVAGTGAPDRTWGFDISFPTTCVPFVITTRIWGTHVLDFCQWQPVVHDIMSLVWISTTLFLCIGMVFRAVTGSPA
jgi:hypothetical protein